MIQRQALVSRITSGQHLALVSISAPTGYGKTTMLRQVVDTDDRRVAWLTLDDRCNDPAIIVPSLVAALDPVLQIDDHVTSLLQAPHAHERSSILELIETSVQSAGLPFVFVIDEVHLLQHPEGLESVWTVFESLPDKSLMILAGQRSPNLPMARQRAGQEVLEIGPSDLAFDLAEARQLFDQAGVSASDDVLKGLIDRTSGWAAALQLATRAAAGDAVPRVDPLSFGGGDRLLASYVKSEILDRLPESSRTFLLRTSILDELTGPLCDYSLQRSDSSRVLVDLDEHRRLAIPLDRERRVYQYSPVLREALRRELSIHGAEQESIIHARASEWYEMQGDVDSAIKHAQAVDDVARVASLLVTFGIREYAVGRAATLRSWFEWLEQHRDFPGEAAIVGAWLHVLAGRAEAAQQWAEYAETAPLDTQMPDGSTCEGWLFTLRAAMAADVDLMKASAIRAIETLSHNSPWRPTALSLLGCAELWMGELEASEVQLRKAAEIGTSLGGNAAAATALAAMAELEIRRDNSSRAQTLVTESLATVERHHLTSYITSSLTFAIAGYCAVRTGDRATASTYLERAQLALPETGVGLGLLGTQSRLALIRIHLALGEAGTAAAALKEVEHFVPAGAHLGTLRTELEELASQLASLGDEVPANLRISPAEMKLLPLLTTAYPLREIASQMYLSVHTVKTQAASIYRKLGVASRAQAVERALALGLVSTEPQLGAHYSSALAAPGRNRPTAPSAR